MTSDEAQLRDEICLWGRSMFERGLTSGASGNLSARLADGVLLTPTNACLGFLDPARLSRLDAEGRHVGGDPPTKEVPLHLAVYRARPQAGGIVHLHSTHATALSCLADVDPVDAHARLLHEAHPRAGVEQPQRRRPVAQHDVDVGQQARHLLLRPLGGRDDLDVGAPLRVEQVHHDGVRHGRQRQHPPGRAHAAAVGEGCGPRPNSEAAAILVDSDQVG